MKSVRRLSAREAAALVPSGAMMMVGGFGMTGTPTHLLHALAETDVKDLTYIANNIGEPGLGGGRLLRNGQIKKAIGSYFTSNRDVVDAVQSGAIEFELMPQGSLAEAIRAGGAGIGGFYTPDGSRHAAHRWSRNQANRRRDTSIRARIARRYRLDPRLARR